MSSALVETSACQRNSVRLTRGAFAPLLGSVQRGALRHLFTWAFALQRASERYSAHDPRPSRRGGRALAARTSAASSPYLRPTQARGRRLGSGHCSAGRGRGCPRRTAGRDAGRSASDPGPDGIADATDSRPARFLTRQARSRTALCRAASPVQLGTATDTAHALGHASKDQRGYVLNGCSSEAERPMQDRAARAVAPEATMRR